MQVCTNSCFIYIYICINITSYNFYVSPSPTSPLSTRLVFIAFGSRAFTMGRNTNERASFDRLMDPYRREPDCEYDRARHHVKRHHVEWNNVDWNIVERNNVDRQHFNGYELERNDVDWYDVGGSQLRRRELDGHQLERNGYKRSDFCWDDVDCSEFDRNELDRDFVEWYELDGHVFDGNLVDWHVGSGDVGRHRNDTGCSSCWWYAEQLLVLVTCTKSRLDGVLFVVLLLGASNDVEEVLIMRMSGKMSCRR